ncbi:MAG: ribonuclease P protein subunit [Candidatus Micrarchaeota archaeon]
MAACEESPSPSVRKQRIDRLTPLLGEIIGERVFVKDSGCRELLALKGVVVDESFSTLLVRTEDGATKRVPKKGSVFVFPDLGGRGAEADGTDLLCRPEDRTKKLASKLEKMRKN